MARRARLRFAGVPLHIIQRGNNRIACFFAEQDYRFYLYHLEELAQRFQLPSERRSPRVSPCDST